MAVYLYFGLPGSGKTTMLAKKAYDASFARKPKYKNIYGNIDLVGIHQQFHRTCQIQYLF